MQDPKGRAAMNWKNEKFYPGPDYLSSSRKRLAPQLIYKGGILNSWNRKTAVALNRGFYNTLPKFAEVSAAEAEVAWMVYDLNHDKQQNRYVLERHKTIYTKLNKSLDQLTRSEAGPEKDFLEHL